MKTPRVHDFDPNAKAPELHSSLEGMPLIQKPQKNISHAEHNKEFSLSTAQSPHQQHELSVPPVRQVRPVRRMMKRHAFDIYIDQLEALQQIAFEERKAGGVGSMSAMIREAIDTLIATRLKKDK